MSEARSEHEWTVAGNNYKVMWTAEGFWSVWALTSAVGDRPYWSCVGRDAEAAEIARLRGLVPPGGEEEKG